mmetsp:Transcript_60189/g.105483  ORF Transcript_60189/g.105483 Transcript_60189/m.105483 type:complete len:88 (+) Transcript_60189:1771-2034(+)
MVASQGGGPRALRTARLDFHFAGKSHTTSSQVVRRCVALTVSQLLHIYVTLSEEKAAAAGGLQGRSTAKMSEPGSECVFYNIAIQTD